MKATRSIYSAAAVGALMLALAAPSASFAAEEAHCAMHQKASPEERTQWAKNQLDKEAARLEIKASQQSAWEAYSAANLELLGSFGDHKPMAADLDAAAAMRQHAEHAEAFAQKLSKLADATEKLRSALTEGQRKVLDLTVRMHSQFAGGGMHDSMHEGMGGHEHGQHHHGDEPAASTTNPPPKAVTPAVAPAKPKK